MPPPTGAGIETTLPPENAGLVGAARGTRWMIPSIIPIELFKLDQRPLT
jgi:hypothetical protein